MVALWSLRLVPFFATSSFGWCSESGCQKVENQAPFHMESCSPLSPGVPWSKVGLDEAANSGMVIPPLTTGWKKRPISRCDDYPYLPMQLDHGTWYVTQKKHITPMKSLINSLYPPIKEPCQWKIHHLWTNFPQAPLNNSIYRGFTSWKCVITEG